MKRLVFITQQVDPEHPVLAATVPKLRALAERVDELVVLADRATEGALPGNCRVKTFAAPTRFGRGLRFLRALWPELRDADAVVAHMVPLYAVLAAPLARARGVTVLLWYTQWRAGPLLRLAEKMVSRVLSVEEASFPLSSRKLRAIGHGIDPGELACREPAASPSGVRLLALGRYSPVKGYAAIVRAMRLARDAGVDATLAIHGPVSNAAEERHREELRRLIEELELADSVRLGDALPRPEALAQLGHFDALVSATVRGAADKVVLEAAFSCVPVLVPVWAFERLVPGELHYAGDPASLAERIADFSKLDTASRRRLGRELRDRALRGHSVDSWADAVVAASS